MVHFLLVKMHQVSEGMRESSEIFAPDILNNSTSKAEYNKRKQCEVFGKLYFHLLLILLLPKITIIDKYNVGMDWYEVV